MGCCANKELLSKRENRNIESRKSLERTDKIPKIRRRDTEETYEVDLFQESNVRRYMERKGLTESILNAKKR